MRRLPVILFTAVVLICWIILLCPDTAGAVNAKVAAGMGYTVVLKADGTIWTWGYNQSGQLGDGTTVDRPSPVQVQGLGNVEEIATGRNHTLVLKSDSTVWAWGANNSGQLGDGTATNRLLPVQVHGLTDVKAIAAGYYSFAVKTDGSVWTWGGTYCGQPGSCTPTQIAGLSDVILAATGYIWSLALKQDGTVWEWQYYNNPVQQVNGLTDVIGVAAGDEHRLALKADGTVWAWGKNSYGQLGDGTTTNRSVPVQVTGLPVIVRIAANSSRSLAVASDGTVWGWGYGTWNQDGASTVRQNPMPVAGIENAAELSAGSGHTVIIKRDGTVWAWGSNMYGQLGTGFTGYKTIPVTVAGPGGIASMGIGEASSFIIKEDGTVLGWGSNYFGALGDGTTTDRQVPAPIAGLTDVAMVAGEFFRAFAVKSDGTVWAWGTNIGYKSPSDPAYSEISLPTQVTGLANIHSLATCEGHTLALKNDGTVWAWGGNYSGQLGDGTTTDRSSPVQVLGLTNIVAVSAHNGHNLALRNDGGVWAWGSNEYGQLGDGTTAERHTPVQVNSLAGIVSIAAAFGSSRAVRWDGTVWAWGWNESGQLGDGTSVNRLSPVQVAGLTGAVSVASSGRDHTLVLRTDGTVWAWGSNYWGQLGDGTTTTRDTPAPVIGLTGVIAIATGIEHNLALTADRTLWAWGSNYEGELGDGTSWSTQPVQTSMVVGDQLAVTKAGNGTGTVNGSQPGIACGTSCRIFYTPGSSVTLTATPDSDSTFMGWSGACSGNAPTCSVTMDGSKTVTATFADITPPSVTASIPGGTYHIAQTVTLSSEAGGVIYYTLDGTDPVTSGTRLTYAVPISLVASATLKYYAVDTAGNSSSTQTQTYTIAYIPYTVSVTKDGTGRGTVSTSPSGITCGTTCTSSFNMHSTVTFIAEAAQGWAFLGWSGGTCSGTGTCSVTVSGNFAVTATFGDIQPPSLAIFTLPSGAWTNLQPLNVAGRVTDIGTVQSLTINGSEAAFDSDGLFSFAVPLIPGPNTITMLATDMAGNSRTDERTVNYRTSPPTVVITSPADNSVVNSWNLNVTGTADGATTITAKLNNLAPVTATMDGNTFSVQLNLSEGPPLAPPLIPFFPSYHTVVITASDQAGNLSSVKRTITHNQAAPNLAITNPVQDIVTINDSILLTGTASDMVESVGLIVDGVTFSPPVNDGAFEQLLIFPDDKTYRITLATMDGYGNVIDSALRNIIHRKPLARIDLIPGWNLISFPAQQGSSLVADVFGPLLSTIPVIWGYDNERKAWKRYKPGSAYNTLTSIESGQGYWVYANESGSLTPEYNAPSGSVQLREGWNLVGYSGPHNRLLTPGLADLSGKWSVVWSWENGQWYMTHEALSTPVPLQPLTAFHQGKAYWVKVKNGTGEVQWMQ